MYKIHLPADRVSLGFNVQCTCMFNFFSCCFLGMSHEGIFRISGNHKVVESLKAAYDKGDVTLYNQCFLPKIIN